MKNYPKVLVLMAVHNGEKWLVEQIHSILSQRNVCLTLVFSDDKSTDSSLEICRSYLSDNIFIYSKSSEFDLSSASSNFYFLLKSTIDLDYDYLALADQDDIWLPDKLSSAISSIELSGSSAYSSSFYLFSCGSVSGYVNKSQPQTSYDFLFESPGPGCTFVLKKNLVTDFVGNFLSSNLNKIKQFSGQHDWFIYAYARYKKYLWFIDSSSFIYYRQHSSNVIGANSSFSAIRKRFSILYNGWYFPAVKNLISIFNLSSEVKLNSTIFILINFSKFRRRFRDKIALLFFLLFHRF